MSDQFTPFDRPGSAEFLAIARKIVSGGIPDFKTLRTIATLDDTDVFYVLAGAHLIREHALGRKVHTCTICNGKSGLCSENCAFCSQSAHSGADSPTYPLIPAEEMRKGAVYAENKGIDRYSVVTSGRGLPRPEIELIADALSGMGSPRLGLCASLGIIDGEDFEILKAAGISRYHHNLETAESHFNAICSTHTYQDRVNTIRRAKDAGLSVCAGGLFGIGETDEQVLELAIALRELDVDAVPINFLTPIDGTPLEGASHLTPLRCLKIIALFRFALPDKDILVCGGRLNNLGALHPLIFYAGASGVMTGNYLTTAGRTLGEDLDMVKELGLTVSGS